MGIVGLNIIRFFLLIFIQIFIVNNINFGVASYLIAPSVYISFLLTFPTNTNRYLYMLLGFAVGLSIDFFQDTYGVHASASVLLAYLRPKFTNRLEDQNTFQETYNLSIYMVDRAQYIIYLLSLTGIFLFWVFLLEEFNFKYLHIILLKTILSTIVSVTLIVIGQFLFFSKPKN